MLEFSPMRGSEMVKTFRATSTCSDIHLLARLTETKGPSGVRGGGGAKNPGRDGTAKCSPHPSWKPQDSRHCGGRWALQGKTN